MLNKAIAKNIILAQIASDGGKDIRTESNLKLSNLYSKKGYKAKDSRILKAIELINNNKNTGFYYHVKFDYYSRNLDSNCYIVYFNYKINKQRQQISFHCFSDRIGRYRNKNTSTKWVKRLDSRECALRLAEYLNIK